MIVRAIIHGILPRLLWGKTKDQALFTMIPTAISHKRTKDDPLLSIRTTAGITRPNLPPFIAGSWIPEVTRI
jgi:hypothetical protein